MFVRTFRSEFMVKKRKHYIALIRFYEIEITQSAYSLTYCLQWNRKKIDTKNANKTRVTMKRHHNPSDLTSYESIA